MRNLIGFGAVATMALGCQPENELRFTSTLDLETNGVVLTDDGLDAHGGMVGTTCTIDVNWGCPTEDADLPTENEKVLDHFAGTTVASSTEGLHIIRGQAWQQDEDLAVAGVVSAHLGSMGTSYISTVDTGCELTLGDRTATVPSAVCGDDVRFAFDAKSGMTFAATDDGIVRMDIEGNDVIGEYGDLIAFDESLGHLYVAQTGGDILYAVRPNGAEIWSAQVGGTISSVAARGTLGEAIVMATAEDGKGLMERRDGRTGELLGRSWLPDGDSEVVVSDNGRTVAHVRPDEVHFYTLEEGTDDDDIVIDETPPDCIVPQNGGGGFGGISLE
ncbi:MAG: hypothetical protein KTR31_13380 [Myxococcales bacterium]|nr:hypothetical protein [Myxococcales bacterium]